MKFLTVKRQGSRQFIETLTTIKNYGPLLIPPSKLIGMLSKLLALQSIQIENQQVIDKFKAGKIVTNKTN
jgi:hypothetical protein